MATFDNLKTVRFPFAYAAREFLWPCTLTLIGLLAPILLGDAVFEVLRSAAEDLDLSVARVVFAGFTYVLLGIATYQLLQSTMEAVKSQPQKNRPANGTEPDLPPLWIDLVFSVASTLPLVGIALAISKASASPEFKSYGNPIGALMSLERYAWCLAAGLAFSIFLLSRSGRVKHVFEPVPAAIVALLSIYFFIPRVQFPSFVSAISVFSTWLACIAVLSTYLSRLRRRSGVPCLSVLVIFGLLFTTLGWNRNHEITGVGSRPLSKHPLVESAFLEWLDKRPDLNDYSDRPYPVFVVTAEGGGLYAAYFTAAVLATLQDICPRFGAHTFAISGVSGGSLGAAIYASLASEATAPLGECDFKTEKRQELKERATKILGQEILTPLLAGTFFYDFFSSALPFSIPALDRGKVFDRSIESLWSKQPSAGILSLPMHQAWRPDGMAPALILNTYDLTTYGPISVSPFRLNLGVVADFYEAAAEFSHNSLQLSYPSDVRVSTAVGLSARFPIVTPEGTYTRPVLYRKPGSHSGSPNSETVIERNEVLRFVDGGYFDNNGAGAIYSLLLSLRQTRNLRLCPNGVPNTIQSPCLAKTFQIYAIQINGPESGPHSSFYGSFATLLKGVTSIRGAWKQNMNDILINEIGDSWGNLPCGRPRAAIFLDTTAIRAFDPDSGMFDLPLSWQLSRTTNRMLDSLLPHASLCHQNFGAVTNTNDCGPWDVKWALESQDMTMECPIR
ncbi:patatin-like phospholipase family protein [Rhizobium sp. PAMB 3174]